MEQQQQKKNSLWFWSRLPEREWSHLKEKRQVAVGILIRAVSH